MSVSIDPNDESTNLNVPAATPVLLRSAAKPFTLPGFLSLTEMMSQNSEKRRIEEKEDDLRRREERENDLRMFESLLASSKFPLPHI